MTLNWHFPSTCKAPLYRKKTKQGCAPELCAWKNTTLASICRAWNKNYHGVKRACARGKPHTIFCLLSVPSPLPFGWQIEFKANINCAAAWPLAPLFFFVHWFFPSLHATKSNHSFVVVVVAAIAVGSGSGGGSSRCHKLRTLKRLCVIKCRIPDETNQQQKKSCSTRSVCLFSIIMEITWG